MNLLIDLGNSRIKWAWSDGADLCGHGAAHYAGQPLTAILADIALSSDSPKGIIVASVAARSVTDELTEWLTAHYQQTPQLIRPEVAGFGVDNAYHEPRRLGADRWAALIAARRRQPDGACVVDCGTAITVDFIDAQGRHRGGLIGPGVLTMRRALYGATAGIPDEGEGTTVPLATDTRSAVTAGTLYAAAAFVERAHAELEREHGSTLPCLLTGGDASVLQPLLRIQYEAVPHLVLEGLAVIAGNSVVNSEH